MAVSHSGLTLYDQCPSAFQRRYLLREATSPREPHPNAARGSEIHADFERYLLEGGDLPGNGMSAWHSLLIKLRAAGATAEREFAFTKDWEICEFDADEAVIRGKIDAEYWSGDSAQMVDVYEWKTGKNYPEHVHQRSLYGLAGLLIYPDAPGVRIHMPYLDRPNERPTVQEFMQGQINSLKWIYERKINKVQPPQEYPMRQSWKCRFCDYSKKVNNGKCPN